MQERILKWIECRSISALAESLEKRPRTRIAEVAAWPINDPLLNLSTKNVKYIFKTNYPRIGMAGRLHVLAFIVAILIIPLMTTNSFAQSGVTGTLTLSSSSIDCNGTLQGQMHVVNTGSEQIYIHSAVLILTDRGTQQEIGSNTFSYSALPVPVGRSVNLPFTITQSDGTTAKDPEPASAVMTVYYDTFSEQKEGRSVEGDAAYYITGCPIHQAGANLTASNSQSSPLSDLPIPSNCLIATAAFGSDLAPQVQFLRVFRDHSILSTAAGSSFMNVFNMWYYSFSPSVANYERGQPWMQQAVRTSIYPLLGMLTLSQDAYSVLPGEYGAISAGLIASSMIGAVYFFPFGLATKQVKKYRLDPRLAIGIVAASIVAVIVSVIAANNIALMASTSMLVLATLSVSAIYSADAITRAIGRFRKKNGTSE